MPSQFKRPMCVPFWPVGLLLPFLALTAFKGIGDKLAAFAADKRFKVVCWLLDDFFGRLRGCWVCTLPTKPPEPCAEPGELLRCREVGCRLRFGCPAGHRGDQLFRDG